MIHILFILIIGFITAPIFSMIDKNNPSATEQKITISTLKQFKDLAKTLNQSNYPYILTKNTVSPKVLSEFVIEESKNFEKEYGRKLKVESSVNFYEKMKQNQRFYNYMTLMLLLQCKQSQNQEHLVNQKSKL